MIWSSFSEFVHMNGYGFYVFGSFGVCLLILLLEARELFSKKQKLRQGTSE